MRQPWGLVSAYRLDITSLQTPLQDPDAEEFVTHTAPLLHERLHCAVK
jgi:hypothetical protein